MRDSVEGKMGKEGLGTHLHSCKDQTQDGAAGKLPRDCLQPSLLALKGQGTFDHIRKTVSLVCFGAYLGKAAPSLDDCRGLSLLGKSAAYQLST